jgi:hypothetical protein
MLSILDFSLKASNVHGRSFFINSSSSRSKETLYIGNNNVFEVRAKVSAAVIGDHNVFEAKCKLWILFTK